MQLYLHIPFCHRICPYCSFYKHTPGNTDMRAFISAIGAEAEFYATKFPSRKINTLYMGGGTPSMLSRTLLAELHTQLNTHFDLSELKEFTFEANPATFDLKKAQYFAELGISRISLGIQSFDDAVLKTLGREHSREDAQKTVPILREAGISEVNIDLMFSIPGQSLDSWCDTLESAIALGPDHISAYNLTYEEDTEFIKKYTTGEYIDDPDTNAKFFHLGHEMLTEAGFDHYETSNYAKSGAKSTHNKSYWQGAEYLGLGPSAVSTINENRWKNVPDTAAYIRQIGSVGHAQTEIENLSDEDFRIERIALMLRTTEGLPVSIFTEKEMVKVQILVSEGLATISAGQLILTSAGSLLVDSVVEHII
ncbi:MAG: oxygen-independent coproporphyrinogen-3 oxidase [Rubritalea sp.]|jgi:oxygen-independent coproporphyrinogen-3 oxidase|tara:strand:- start:3538 stop:4635 length:1098 start_codon:yes stop_codon:yes gene_type:complete